MKIGELGERCENCPLVRCCASKDQTPELCYVEEVANMEVEDYRRIYDSVTDEEIRDRIRYNEENGDGRWSDEIRGAVCDIVLEKWRQGTNCTQVGMKRTSKYTRRDMRKDGWIPVTERYPDSDDYILVSYENFSIPDIARYEEDENGGAFYQGDDEKSCVQYGLVVNAWQPLPEQYEEECGD